MSDETVSLSDTPIHDEVAADQAEDSTDEETAEETEEAQADEAE